jgi:hypothetical protein
VIRTRLVVLCAIIAPAALLAQEKYTIKIKHAGAGDVALHTREQTKSEAITILGTDGNVAQEKKQTTVSIDKFKEEIVEKPSGRRATKVNRTYTEATKKVDDQSDKRAYDGKTVAIELKGDKYQFTVDGKELTGDDAGELPENFNAKKPGDEELDKILLPGKQVGVGDSWEIDGKKFAKLFGEEEKIAKTLDLDHVKSTGKLVKAYKKDGHQFGVLEYRIEIPVKALEGEHPCREGAKMEMSINIDGCIDGSVDADTGMFTMKISGTADHVENGQKSGIVIKFDISQTEKGTNAPVKK